MKMGEKIAYYRKLIGMSQDELAKKVGYKGKSAISKIESGERDIVQDKIVKFARVLGVDPVSLLDDRVQGSPIWADEIMVPEVATVAAGFDKLPISDFEYESFPIPRQYAKGFQTEDLFIIKVRGDSMYPLYQDGDRILAVRSQNVEDGNVAILQYGDYATIKTIRTHLKGLELVPANPMFKPEIVTENDAVRVIGRPILLLREIMQRN